MKTTDVRIATVLAVVGLAGHARAQMVVADTFTGASSELQWRAIAGACLTAGNNTGTIPACNGLPYYRGKELVGGTGGRLPDRAGSGALRLTNGDYRSGGSNGDKQNGAVVSDFTFPAGQGLDITFTAVTYGGDNHEGRGADGISFFLADGSRPPTVGALGGSLGYSCANGNAVYDGVAGAYIGLGIDEFGNFSNKSDNTTTGSGPNGGAGATPGRISLRGAGDVNWASLSARYPQYYPASLNESLRSLAVRATCAGGILWDFSAARTNFSGQYVSGTAKPTTEKVALNYNYMAHSDPGIALANQQGVHMPLRGKATPITYALRLTQNGRLSLSYSVNGGATRTVLNDKSIVASNGPLPPTFRFGFAAGTGDGSNVHELLCFRAAPADQSAGSAGANLQESSRVETGTQIYKAFYQSTNWSGALTAHDLVSDATGVVSISPRANWNAGCSLTGGNCAETGASAAAQSPDSRTILTWDGTRGVPFRWASLAPALQATLTAGDTGQSDARLNYLRGDRSKEINNAGAGTFRARGSVLGDIINASPDWAGNPSAPYAGTWADALYPKAAMPERDGKAQTYAQYKTAHAQRQHVVYVGSNDGLLHGFRAGRYDNDGRFTSDAATPNDGREVLAYMPGAVLGTIHSTDRYYDFSAPEYAHNLYVDATPGTGDLFYAGAWHTWLVGGLGGGGNAAGPAADRSATASGTLYALDVSDPSRFSESHAASLVVGEWSSRNIACANVADCGKRLGSTYGRPQIRRLHNGMWAVLFGNGLNSAAGTAGLFIMLADPVSGAISFRYLDTGSGAAGGAKNGIAHVTPADLDRDHITDYVYAGDVLGNIWRFDLTSSNPNEWHASAKPLFSTEGAPVTTSLVAASVPGKGVTGKPRMLLSFGTGQRLEQTQTNAATFASGTHHLYGIWDWDMAGWNAKAGPAAQFTTLTAQDTVTRASLQAQAITGTLQATATSPAYRSVSRNDVCWKDSPGCTGASGRMGWVLALPEAGEQVVYNPILSHGMVMVNTIIPADQQLLSCDNRLPRGFTMALSLGSGGALAKSFFGPQGLVVPNAGDSAISGVGLNATGASTVVNTEKGGNFLVAQTVDGKGATIKINPPPPSVRRLNWIQLR
ncbi:PilC/PilY family type IV pilus protein [Cupriavidus pinatubonensis]|uniref:PilY1 beta-propeller domain-containing protein n=1 Tax=Cupriavidus pinatubonensis TaxID=248026 RepID=A0ABM8XLW5_9BURK|nr:PilC/PilY family type IV pilus protein [Cupriavidus pinatubonensis]CAG9181202.1 hypothetical protein LMG23994_04614 [Cupriavidus pinatubonensis]